MGTIRNVGATALVTAGLMGAALLTPPAGASPEQPSIVSANPVNTTPHVTDGRVLAIAQVGNMIVLGGTFTQVTNAAGTQTLTRNRLVAFDATTGAISTTFNPGPNNTVEALTPAADGSSVYVAGRFTSIGGAPASRLARLDVATGARVPGFNPGNISALVRDMKRVGNDLYLSGRFGTVAGQSRGRMASLDATTGALTGKLNLAFTGVNHGGSTSVNKFEVTPNGSRLIAMGNFSAVAGQSRGQVAMIDTSGASATLSSWATNAFPDVCAGAFDTYLRDVDVSPDGSYFILSTTGAYRGATTLCDTISRWEVDRAGGGQQPTWVDHTGGDTTYAVTATGTAVYAGGHFRWLNNPFAGDRAGAGAVPREGIAAMDPKSGLPFTWNPGRARGVGVFDMLATGTGLWVGSDTIRIGGETHRRIAMLPLAGGTAVPAWSTPSLPGTVLQLGRTSGAQDEVRRTPLSAAGSPGTTTTSAGNDSFRNSRGAFVIGSTLYTPWSDGTLRARTISGTTLGAARTVNLYGGSFGTDARTVTGIAFDAGTHRIYYTLSGDSRLFWRWFNPQSEIVGAVRYETPAAALPAVQVRGLFASGGQLYFASSAGGALYRIGFQPGVTGSPGPGVTGSPVLVDASRDWTAPGVTLTP